jgi:hypothetical protein
MWSCLGTHFRVTGISPQSYLSAAKAIDLFWTAMQHTRWFPTSDNLCTGAPGMAKFVQMAVVAQALFACREPLASGQVRFPARSHVRGLQQVGLEFWGSERHFSSSSALVSSAFEAHPVRCQVGRVNFRVDYRRTGPPGAAVFLESSLTPDRARDFTGHSTPIFGGPQRIEILTRNAREGSWKLAPRKRPEASASFGGCILHASGQIQFVARGPARCVSE